MDFTFFLDLGEFPGIGSSRYLPVSTTVTVVPSVVSPSWSGFLSSWTINYAHSEMKMLKLYVKANANWNILNVTYLALIPIVYSSVEEL